MQWIPSWLHPSRHAVRCLSLTLLWMGWIASVALGQGDRKPMPKTAVFAGGCFWCVESDMERAPGVIDVVSGYTGGKSNQPTYKNYAIKGHREAVLVTYDASRVTYAGLLEYFLKHIDPVDKGGAFIDRGKGYSPAIYVENDEERQDAKRVIEAIDGMKVLKSALTIPVLDRTDFFPAEGYHQNYHTLNAVAYGVYRQRCGRDDYVRKMWGERANRLELTGAFPESSDLVKAPAGMERQGVKGDPSQAKDPLYEKWQDYKKPEQEQLKKKLSRNSFRITQSAETEPAFRNEFWDHHEAGIYVDIVSGEPLFASFDKFESGTGWPSFVRPIDPHFLTVHEDNTEGVLRVEVRSRYADSHLGHVFTDGPVDRGGLRFCINSAALRFIPLEKLRESGYPEIADRLERKSQR